MLLCSRIFIFFYFNLELYTKTIEKHSLNANFYNKNPIVILIVSTYTTTSLKIIFFSISNNKKKTSLHIQFRRTQHTKLQSKNNSILIFAERLLAGDWLSAIDVPVLLINNSFTVSFLYVRIVYCRCFDGIVTSDVAWSHIYGWLK